MSPPSSHHRRIAPAIAGALVIHLLLGYCGAKLVADHRPSLEPRPPPPRVELVDIEVVAQPSPVVAPAPAPLPPTAAQPTEVPPVSVRQPASRPRTTRGAAPQLQTQPQPQPQEPALPTTGNVPVIAVPDVGVGATGVRAETGSPATHPQSATANTGASLGDGLTGAASIAAIKTRAMPKGDFAYRLVKDYPPEAKQRGIEGKIRVRLVVDERGGVTAATLLNRLGFGLDEQAAQRARELEFEPARDTADKPVRSIVVWTFDFTLPK